MAIESLKTQVTIGDPSNLLPLQNTTCGDHQPSPLNNLVLALGQTRTDTPMALDPKSSASTNSATRARKLFGHTFETNTNYDFPL